MFSLSIRQKIALVMTLVVSIATAGMAFTFIYQSKELSLDAAKREIGGQTRLLASRFKNRYTQLSGDLFVLAASASVKAAERQMEADLAAGQAGSLYPSTATGLQDSFRAIMSVQPEYTQLRLITVADQGRELLRMNRVNGTLKVVKQGALQQKGGEAYFKKAVAMYSHHGAGAEHSDHHITFSDITLNRENGVVTEPKTAMLRAIWPLYSTRHALLGFLVANIDYEKLLVGTFRESKPGYDAFVINRAGDYLEYSGDGSLIGLQLSGGNSAPVPKLVADALSNTSSELAIDDGNNISYLVRVNVNDLDAENFITIGLKASRKVVLAGVSSLGKFGMILGGAFVLLAILAATALANIVTKPLRELTQSVKDARTTETPVKLPSHRKDEIGVLANAFLDLSTKLSDNEEMMRSTIDSIGEGIIVIDAQGTIVSVNPACKKIFGYGPGQLSGRNVSVLMPKSHGVQHTAYLERYTTAGTKKIAWAGRQEVGLRRDGSTFPLELTVNELITKDRLLFVGIVRDITAREAADKAKAEFTSTVSHELRTPLTSVLGALGLVLSGKIEKVPPKTQRMLEIANENGTRLIRLIEDLLDMERIASGKLRMEKHAVDLNELAKSAVEQNVNYGAKNNIAFEFVGSGDPVIVDGDDERLMQVVTNLLTNASKFSPRGETVQVDVRANAETRTARLSVEDRGPGIVDDVRDKVFKKFTQIDSSDQRSHGGVGLGLAISKEIVELHGGTINFSSQVGRGTTFYFDLPLVE